MSIARTYHPTQGVMVTGAAGFIGSSFMPILMRRFASVPVYAIDLLTYAGSRDNLHEFDQLIEKRGCGSQFHQIDITDFDALSNVFAQHPIDTVIHFAAETHVDRSLAKPDVFFHTNVIGTSALLQASRQAKVQRFVHISTDEVYGPTPEGVEHTESYPMIPSSPYAASKAGADAAVMAYHRSYNLPTVIVRGSNNYGPRQYPEKLIPFFIARALEGKSLPVYGSGNNEREWIHTRDFSAGILSILEHGLPGEIYNLGGQDRLTNIQLTEMLIAELQRHNINPPRIENVTDRPGHDVRYRMNCDKVKSLGFRPSIDLKSGLAETVDWYLEHRDRLALQVANDSTLNRR